MEINELMVVDHQQQQSIIDLPVDIGLVYRLWERAKIEFVSYVRSNSKGMNPDNIASAYGTALNQFFDGIYSSSGEVIWPELPATTPISPAVANKYKQVLAEAGKAVYGGSGAARAEIGRTGLAPASVGLKLAALKSFFDYVQFVYLIPFNPSQHGPFVGQFLFLSNDKKFVTLVSQDTVNPFNTKGVKRPSVPQYGRSVILTTEEVGRILGQINPDSLTGIRDYALIYAIFSTGCRVSEITSLKWGDLAEQPDGSFVFKFQGKNKKINQVQMKRPAYGYIVEYLAAAGRLDGMRPDDYIFTSVLGPERVQRIKRMWGKRIEAGPISTSRVNRILKKYAGKAGIEAEKAHPHALRHARLSQTAIDSAAMNNGAIDIVAINQLARHSSLDMTRVYIDSVLRKVEDKYGDAAIAAVEQATARARRQRKRGKRKPAAEQLEF